MKTNLPRFLPRISSAALLVALHVASAAAQDAPTTAETPAAAATPRPAASAAETLETVIDRARSYLGTDEALDAVKSLHLFGTVTAQDGDTHQIEIIMQRPMQQMVIETTPDKRLQMVLDDYTGWGRQDLLAPERPGSVKLMNADEVRSFRANLTETLYYYDLGALRQVGAKVALTGAEEIDGILCDQVIFIHPGGVQFTRFFDRATGRLVLTRTNLGTEAREAGEQIVAGVRFPKELHTRLPEASSKVTFDEIRVNEEFPAEMFKMPVPKFEFGRKPSEPATRLDPPELPSESEPLKPNLPTVPAPQLPEAPELPDETSAE